MATRNCKNCDIKTIDHVIVKIKQIKRILMEEFPEEATDEKAELVANRLYDQIMYENKDI